MNCPRCDSKAVDVTLAEDRVRRYLCCGPVCHEFLETEIPSTEPEPQEEMDLDSLADLIADRVHQKMKPDSLVNRVLKAFRS